MINWLVLPCRDAAKADLVEILQCVGRAALGTVKVEANNGYR